MNHELRFGGLRRLLIAACAAGCTLPALATTTLDKATVLVYDASGSMWGQLAGGSTKVEVARQVIGDFFVSRDATLPLGVVAYGHNRRGDCEDIELIAAVDRHNAETLSARLNQLTPRGMTPLTEALRRAAAQIPATAESADIILVTDGLETCDADPCALAADLAAEGITIRAHVVGFGLTEQEATALSCLPDQTGGLLLRPQSGAELADALRQIDSVQATPEPELSRLSNRFVFEDTGTGTPSGQMNWRAIAEDGEEIEMGSTSGHQENREGIAATLPPGRWTIRAEGDEGTAERQLELRTCCGHHRVPFTSSRFSAEIPTIGQVQAGMAARVPFRILGAGAGNLGAHPYTVIATGPAGTLTRDQVLHQDLITSREPRIHAADIRRQSAGTYRLVVALVRGTANYEIIAEQPFEVVERPLVQIIGPDRAVPGERVDLALDGGYATGYAFEVLNEEQRRIGQSAALYQRAGGSLSVQLTMPTIEGRYEIAVRHDGEIIARKPILVSHGTAIDADPAAQGGPSPDGLPLVRARFKVPEHFPATPLWWSAAPLDPDMSPEAWAPIEQSVVAEGEFEPGRYEVSALAPGEVQFRAEVEIVPGQRNEFIIALADDAEADLENAGIGQPAVFTCTDDPSGCAYVDPETGLQLRVPDGWSLTQPYHYETAAGVRANVASATLFRMHDDQLLSIELNPRQWMASAGPCIDAGAHRLCHADSRSPALDTALAVIRASL